METYIYDGYRYLSLLPEQVYRLTPREFTILMDSYTERLYDNMERTANEVMMMRAAYHAKKLKQSDLFKRPSGDIDSERTADDVLDRQRRIADKLRRYKEFQDIESV